MPATRTAVCAALLTVLGLTVAGCGDDGQSTSTSPSTALNPPTAERANHGSVEKTGPLPGPLSLDGQPGGADPDVGDIGYYAPGNDLVLYYGDQSYYAGIVVLGHLDGDAAGRIAGMDGAITATVEVSAG